MLRNKEQREGEARVEGDHQKPEGSLPDVHTPSQLPTVERTLKGWSNRSHDSRTSLTPAFKYKQVHCNWRKPAELQTHRVAILSSLHAETVSMGGKAGQPATAGDWAVRSAARAPASSAAPSAFAVHYLISFDLMKTRNKTVTKPPTMSPRPPGGKRKGPRRKQSLSLSQVNRTLQPESSSQQ